MKEETLELLSEVGDVLRRGGAGTGRKGDQCGEKDMGKAFHNRGYWEYFR